jgi:hypothetical protein
MKPQFTSMMRPKRFSWIALMTRCGPGAKGNSDEQRTNVFGMLLISSTIAVAAGRSIPNGFSPSRCFPARTMSM